LIGIIGVRFRVCKWSVAGGEVIQYFVVAQDGAANFASSPTGASYSSAAAPVTTINARPATLQSYRIFSTDLSALALSSGTLAPGFAANVTTYTATVDNTVSSLLVTATPADSTATVTVNGSTPASLDVGANTLTIVVTASDSTTKTYTVTVTRAGSSAPDIAVTQTSAVADGGSIDFGNVTLGNSSAAKTFTITNPGTADLTSLAFAAKDGTNPGDFTVSALSGTSVPVGSGSVTFSVTFNPSAGGARSAGIHITSNVGGAKNPFDITLTGTGEAPASGFASWAASNGVSSDPNAFGSNGVKNLLNFAFNVNPTTGGSGALAYTGTFGGPLLTDPITTGQQSTKVEPSGNVVDFRGLFVRRKDAASAGLTYTPQFSPDMITWQDSAATPTVLADDGTNQIVSVPYPVFIAGKKARFFRISVTINP
jgi:hypothetical protein